MKSDVDGETSNNLKSLNIKRVWRLWNLIKNEEEKETYSTKENQKRCYMRIYKTHNESNVNSAQRIFFFIKAL